MGPVSFSQTPTKKPTSALFTAADESGTYVDAHDIVARKRIFAGHQRAEQEALLGQGAQPAQRPAHAEVTRVPRQPVRSPNRGELGIVPRPAWAAKVHPELKGRASIPQWLDQQLEKEYQNYVNNQLAVAQLGQGQQRLDRSGRRDELYDERTKAMYPPGWREASRAQPDAEGRLRDAAIEEQVAGSKTKTGALRRYKAAAAGGKTPAGLKQLDEMVFGIVPLPGLVDNLKGKATTREPQKGPVGGWVHMYEKLNGFGMTHPNLREMIIELLAQHEPSVLEMEEALTAGMLTPAHQTFVRDYLAARGVRGGGAAW